jgi:hypothetical protein
MHIIFIYQYSANYEFFNHSHTYQNRFDFEMLLLLKS